MNTKLTAILAFFLFGLCMSQEINLRITQLNESKPINNYQSKKAANNQVEALIENLQKSEQGKCFVQPITDCNNSFFCLMKLKSLMDCSKNNCGVTDVKTIDANQYKTCSTNFCQTQSKNIGNKSTYIYECLLKLDNLVNTKEMNNEQENENEEIVEEEDKQVVKDNKQKVAEEDQEEVLEEKNQEEQEKKQKKPIKAEEIEEQETETNLLYTEENNNEQVIENNNQEIVDEDKKQVVKGNKEKVVQKDKVEVLDEQNQEEQKMKKTYKDRIKRRIGD
ncbi:hypothetical protein ABPG73_007840 [Tetrahymena malaccensis]